MPRARRTAAALTLAIAAAAAVAACAPRDEAPQDTAPPPRDPNTPLFTASTGMNVPESVLWDATREQWLVSNINGNPPEKDDNGFILRLDRDGKAVDSLPFINGADDDVTLHAPKGMALAGDTLWVADIDVVRAFDLNTGNPVASVNLAGLGAIFLNDVAVGNDGGIYVTDSGIRFAADGSVQHPGRSRVFVVRNLAATEAVVLPRESAANGIAWNAARNAWWIVGFNSPNVFEWVPSAKEATVLGTGPGGADGLIVLSGSQAVFSSWADSSLTMFEGGQSRTLRKGLPSPADLGYDPERKLVAVPIFTGNRVEFWPLDG